MVDTFIFGDESFMLLTFELSEKYNKINVFAHVVRILVVWTFHTINKFSLLKISSFKVCKNKMNYHYPKKIYENTIT